MQDEYFFLKDKPITFNDIARSKISIYTFQIMLNKKDLCLKAIATVYLLIFP